MIQKRAALVEAGHEMIELYFEDLLRLEERLGGPNIMPWEIAETVGPVLTVFQLDL